jgi:hypothetical protein
LFVLLLARERVAAEPILPLPLFRNRVFAVAITVVAITATALFGAFVFLPTFFQLVQGKSPSDAGLLTAPLMAGLIEDQLEFIVGQLARVPTRAYLCRTLLLATASIWALLAVLLIR